MSFQEIEIKLFDRDEPVFVSFEVFEPDNKYELISVTCLSGNRMDQKAISIMDWRRIDREIAEHLVNREIA